MIRARLVLAAALLLLTPLPVRAQFALEDFALTDCGENASLFRSGLEAAEQAGVSASGGTGGETGGETGGAVSLLLTVPDTGRTQTFLLHIPTGYEDQAAWPLVIALHGSPGSASAAPAAAAATRNLWRPLAEREGAVILAPIGGGATGSWAPSFDTPALACAVASIEKTYNIDRARRYLWGFSAGGHYGHALALANAQRFAAYGVNAGALYGFACGPPGSVHDCAVTLPQVARRIPVSLRVGARDPLQPYVTGDGNRFAAAGWSTTTELTYSTFVGGHTIGSADVEVAWAWFGPHRLEL